MMHPHTRVAFIDDAIGQGVIATEFLPAGTITWVQDPLDRVFSPAEVDELPARAQQLLDYFAFRNAHGDMVLCWDHARYVNHSFRSNCLSTAYDFEIAIRDIQPGEQLTDDYGYLNLETPWRPQDEGTRRKWVRPDDVVRYAPTWDRALHRALRRAPRLEQALGGWLSPAMREELEAVSGGRRPMRSIRELYYPSSRSAGPGH